MPEPDVGLRQHIEMRVDSLDAKIMAIIAANDSAIKSRIETVDTKLTGRMNAADIALSISAVELHRRLENLNHGQEIAREKDNTFLPRETWEAYVKTNESWRESVIIQMAANSGKGAAYSSMVAVVLALAGIVLHFLK